MPRPDAVTDAAATAAFLRIAGRRAWSARIADLRRQVQAGPLSGRAAQQRHAIEFALARAAAAGGEGRQGAAERHVLLFAKEAVRLSRMLPEGPRARLRAMILEGLSGERTLIPLFHLLRCAAAYRARGFAVDFAGLAEGAPYDLRIARAGIAAEVACETVSAEEGRPVHRGDWCALVDRVHPGLQTWLAAHPGRYLLKMTLPEGLSGPGKAIELQARIMALLAAEKRQDASADAVLKLDPLVLAGAQAGGALPRRLREQFGPEAHLAVTADAAGGSVFVMAARAGRENGVAEAVAARLRRAAESRLSRQAPGILSVMLDDLGRAEWRALCESLALEGAVRRFLTEPAARPVVAAVCASRLELFGGAPPDAAAEGELRFRNPSHPAARCAELAPAVSPAA